MMGEGRIPGPAGVWPAGGRSRRGGWMGNLIRSERLWLRQLEAEEARALLEQAGVQVIPDLCWCSISRPVFPVKTRTLMTNSGKYAHYGPGLSGCRVRFGNLGRCIEASLTGRAGHALPMWLTRPQI